MHENEPADQAKYHLHPGTQRGFARSFAESGDASMTSNGNIFFAGVGTTFLILGAGFGSGLLMANSALKEPATVRSQATTDLPSPIRVILPASAEAAEPAKAPQQKAPQQVAQPVALPQVQQPAQAAQVSTEKAEKSDKADNRRAESDKRRKRIAEQKVKRLAAARRTHQPEAAPRAEAPVMAFGGDESRPNDSFNLFGN